MPFSFVSSSSAKKSTLLLCQWTIVPSLMRLHLTVNSLDLGDNERNHAVFFSLQRYAPPRDIVDNNEGRWVMADPKAKKTMMVHRGDVVVDVLSHTARK
jgi:hypothetical protein